jgi:hypothetical protein
MFMKGFGRTTAGPLIPAVAGLVILLGSLMTTALQADDAGAEADDAETASVQTEETGAELEEADASRAIGGNNQDPDVMLQEIAQRRTQRAALFQTHPLKSLHDGADKWNKDLYEEAHVDLGASIHHLFQWLSESLPGTDDWGTATDMDVIARWDVLNRGEPMQLSVTGHIEGRYQWGTTGPQALGAGSLGMLSSTGNTYESYVPVAVLRNFYFQIGGPKSKGAIRAGKITPDGMYGITRHLTPNISCLSWACSAAFAIGVPDSGVGVVGAWHFNDRFKIKGSVNDSNASRFNWGDVSAGDFFTAIDFGVKIWPLTEKAGYSTFTLWHNDGTKDGSGGNGGTGKEGWGYYFLHEQELTRDGNLVAIFKYGRSMKESALWKRHANIALVMYEPSLIGTITNDSVGISWTMIKAVNEGARREQNVETWYKFPLFPGLDMTLHYQAIINPSLDHTNDFASAFSLRFTTAF